MKHKEIDWALRDPRHEHAWQLARMARRPSELREIAIRTLGLHRDPAPAPSVGYLSRAFSFGFIPVQMVKDNPSMVSDAHVKKFVQAREVDGRDPALIAIQVPQTPHVVANKNVMQGCERLAGYSEDQGICGAPRPPSVRPRASDLADQTALFAPHHEEEMEGSTSTARDPPPCPSFTWEGMPTIHPQALLTRLRLLGLSVEPFLEKV